VADPVIFLSAILAIKFATVQYTVYDGVDINIDLFIQIAKDLA
jgi:hypothetical protein